MQRYAYGLGVPTKVPKRVIRGFRRDMISRFLGDGQGSWKESWSKNEKPSSGMQPQYVMPLNMVPPSVDDLD